MTIGPDNQLSMCPLSDVIYITRLSLFCCPLSACDQSFPAQIQNRPLTKQTVNVVDCLLRRLKILIVWDLYKNKATLTLRESTRWRQLYADILCYLLFQNSTVFYSYQFNKVIFCKISDTCDYRQYEQVHFITTDPRGLVCWHLNVSWKRNRRATHILLFTLQLSKPWGERTHCIVLLKSEKKEKSGYNYTRKYTAFPLGASW